MTIAVLLAGIAAVLWAFVRSARRDHDALVKRQQQHRRDPHTPTDRDNPDYIPGHGGGSSGIGGI